MIMIQLLFPKSFYFFHILFYLMAGMNLLNYVRNLRLTGDVELLSSEMQRIKKNIILWLCFLLGLVVLLLLLFPQPLLTNIAVLLEFFVLALPIALSGETFMANFLRFQKKINKIKPH